MSKKVYRRLLLTAMMLVITPCLAITSPAQQLDCEQCFAYCDANYEACTAGGAPPLYCSRECRYCYDWCMTGPPCNP
jgi:hypothetical protein